MLSDDQQTIDFNDGTKYYLKPIFSVVRPNIVRELFYDVFKGKDINEKDVIVTCWKIALEKLRHKCPINCNIIGTECNHNIEDIIEEFKKRAKFLIENVHHDNLIPYLNVSCNVSDEYFNVNLVRECVEGGNIQKLFNQGVVPSLPLMAESILKAVLHLHSMDPKITHGLINEYSIFLDKSGVYRVLDFHLIPYLLYLNGSGEHPAAANDLNDLGFLMNYGNIKTQRLMNDFIQKCYSNEAQSCWDLLSHEYLTNVHSGQFNPIYDGPFLKHFNIEREILGSGSFGSVIKAKHSDGQDSYALKLVEIPMGSERKCGKVKREVELISQLSHDNVIKYVRSWEQEVNLAELDLNDDESESYTYTSSNTPDLTNRSDESNLSKSTPKNMMIIQMEVCKMTLKDAMNEKHAAKERIPFEWFTDIVHGLSYLHYNEIIHRDLNPKNILLAYSGRLKIADFGLATTTELVFKQKQKSGVLSSDSKGSSSQTGCVGTSYYVAPELTNEASKSTYGTKSDIYSLGMIYFEMKHPPFGTESERHKVLTDARNNIFPDFMHNKDGIYNIIKKMLDHDANSRPNANQIEWNLLCFYNTNIFSELGSLFC